MATGSLTEFRTAHAQAIARFYRRGRCVELGLDEAELAAALYASARAWDADAEPAAIDQYLEALRAEDFALARACARGNERAWERFIAAYRPGLYAAARALTHDEARAGELADSLWAELYGLEARDGERRSLLAYFGGRSALATWLRAVLAQRFVDSARAAQRLRPLEERPAEPATDGDPPDPDRARYLNALSAALTAALATIEPRERLRLSYYYLENMTLGEVGRLLAEHPSTVSRALERTRSALKREVERRLRREQNLNEEQIRLCYDYAAEQWPFDLGRALSESE
ncbi:MAG TPA: sigma-70 family RNA polymerase sigma factor [Candidatus Binataceae bacterium]|jgi:RNA polymerase sigma-70 factor (ECF subfamily)|nr:sigma-70 family RNA polymerase sigma factor [Candidatus Binataceae bacterium]